MSEQGYDALALVEISSIAIGYRVLNELIKRAPVHILDANLTEPSEVRHCVLGAIGRGGRVNGCRHRGCWHGADVSAADSYAHRDVITALGGTTLAQKRYDCIGVVDCESLSATLIARDRALKEALVSLIGIRLVNGLGGRVLCCSRGAARC